MLNLNSPIKYSKIHKNYIKKLRVPEYKDWDAKNAVNKAIKKNIKEQLLIKQNKMCVYCGLKLGETSREEIEHIAPRKLYPQFEYVTKNLAIACQFCNSSSKKGQRDTIDMEDDYYNKCKFNIVHPYYDDVNNFFEYVGAIIKINKNLVNDDKIKAENTIQIFGLSDICHVEARQKQMIFEEFKSKYKFDEINEMLIKNISEYV